MVRKCKVCGRFFKIDRHVSTWFCSNECRFESFTKLSKSKVPLPKAYKKYLKGYTFAKLAKKYGVSREYVRQRILRYELYIEKYLNED